MPDQSAAAPARTFVEGVDYYIDAGRWVFTAAFHRERGYCCRSGCRHCPYGDASRREPGGSAPADGPRG